MNEWIRKLCLIIESQLIINIAEIMLVWNCHWATIRITIQKRTLMMDVMFYERTCGEEWDVFMVSKYPPIKYLFITKEESDFTEEKPGRHHLFQVIKVNSIMCHSKGYSKSTLAVGPNHEEIGHKLDLKNVLQNNCLIIFKSIKVIEVKERLRNCCRLMETRETE